MEGAPVAAGMIPVVGAVADVANGAWYAADGDWLDAGLSFAGAIPVTGDAALGARYAVKGAKAQAVAEENVGNAAKTAIDPSKVLYRFGTGPETTEGLAADAQRAVEAGFPHGISTMSKLPPRIAATGEYRSTTVGQLIEAGFDVMKTGRNPYHYTVGLPQPVTSTVSDVLNEIFGGIG